MNKDTIMSLIKNPPSEYRAKPFWSWNGKLDREELLRQVEVLHGMGFGGFFMHSRTGLRTEYLGEEWFECVRACALKAKEFGMEAWLYDEDRWPSGTCGGEVTRERKNRLRFVSLYDTDADALACPEAAGILARYAVLFEKDNKGEKRLIDCYSVTADSEVKEGYEYAVFAEEEQACEEFYNGFTYIDAMNREVTELFLKSTHEKYAQCCGDLFGSVIKGIFTDEPHRGALFNGFGINNANRARMAPYTAALPEAYRKKYGEELCFPLLYWRKKGEDFNTAASAYVDVMDDLFTQNFAKPCRDWCAAHGLILTGHILHEDNLSIQTSMTGSCMRYYEYMDYPGIDVLGENTDIYWAAKQCSSVARQLGKKFVLSELYGATGWDMTLDRYKKSGDWQALFGISLRCPHLSWYTMKGEAKRDYPASILHQLSFYKEWKSLEDYFARLAVLNSEGTRICDTLVLTPMREMWGKVRMGWMNIFTPDDSDISDLDAAYIEDFKTLTERGIDFDYGDEEILRKYGKVVKENGKAYLQVGRIRYSEILWERRGRIGGETRRLLDKFLAAGGKLVGEIEKLSPEFRIKAPVGTGYAAYELGGDIWLFLLNLDKEKGTAGALELPERLKGYCAEKWNFRDGKSEGKTEISETTAGRTISVSLVGGEECIFRFTKDAVKHTECKEYPLAVLPEEFDYRLTEPNVLPLDCAIWETDGVCMDGGKEKDVLLIDRIIRWERGAGLRGGAMLQPWFVEKYGGGKAEKKLCRLKLTFSFEAEIVPQKIYLAKESGKLDCFVNGRALGEKCDFYWVDRCFDVYPIEIGAGKNEIVLEGDFCADDGLEAVYLIGEFGVKLPRTLTALPKKLRAGDIAPQGFPHYTGAIEYYTGICSGDYTLAFEKLGCAVMKVRGGKEEKTLAFAPYATQVSLRDELVLKLAFPRRNTFGPLYQPYPQPCYGPESFLCDGEWRVEYKPIPQGLYR